MHQLLSNLETVGIQAIFIYKTYKEKYGVGFTVTEWEHQRQIFQT